MSSPPTAPVEKPISIQPALPPATREATRKWRFRGWLAWLMGIVALLLIAVIYWQMTYVSGMELSSHSWEQRGFSLRRDPFTGIQFTGVQHNPPQRLSLWTSTPNANAQTLPTAISQHLSKTTSLPLRWDLVRLDNSSRRGGAASIMVELLGAHDRQYAPFWPQWSVDHPTLAALVWPAAQHLVEFERYDQLPALLNLALLENSSSQLETALGQLVQSALVEYCLQQTPQRNPNGVRQAAQVGLQYGPHPQLQKLLGASP